MVAFSLGFWLGLCVITSFCRTCQPSRQPKHRLLLVLPPAMIPRKPLIFSLRSALITIGVTCCLCLNLIYLTATTNGKKWDDVQKLLDMPENTTKGAVRETQNITFVITTTASPIHPSTCIIKKTLNSIPADFPILVSFDICDEEPQDGPKGTKCERYEKYKNTLLHHIQHVDKRYIQTTEIPRHTPGRKLTRNLRHALSLVKTEFVVIVQDDMHFLRPIPFADIAIDMLEWSNNLTYVSFSMAGRGSHNVTFDVEITGHAEVVGHSTEGPSFRNSSTSYMTTSIWTDNNYICPTHYIRNLVENCRMPYPEWCQMKVMDSNQTNYTWDHFHTWRYGRKGSKPMIGHLDGRRSTDCDVVRGFYKDVF